jgi:hypothetical protein
MQKSTHIPTHFPRQRPGGVDRFDLHLTRGSKTINSLQQF